VNLIKLNFLRVVTGVKFSFNATYNTLYLEIQEGKLLNGSIIDSEVEWISNLNFNEYETLLPINYERRDIYFSDLTVDDGHVVTGVRFVEVPGINAYGGIGGFGLEIRATKIDIKNGQLLNLQESKWITPSIDKRYNYKRLVQPDIPIYSTDNKIISRPLEYIRLQVSHYEKDAGMHTVPFFDIQPVATNPPVPLAGMGVILKGRKASGGFIAPKIKTIDLSYIIEH
jgi:hypothetical protein